MIGRQMRGFEIDPFAAWLTQVWLEIALADLLAKAGQSLPDIVHVCDALNQEPNDQRFDLVIGNPPRSRIAYSGATPSI